MKYCAIALICILSLGGLLSCGLEAYYYIDFIRPGDYRDTNATIYLPTSAYEGYSVYFKNFIIFYRIYASSRDFPSTVLTAEDRSSINSTLNNDYNSFFNLTPEYTGTSVSTSNLENTFDTRNYFKLTLEGENIDNVLGSRALGETLEIFFSTLNGVQPTLTINETPYVLQRATEGRSRIFAPEPDRRFLNSPDLYDSTKALSNAPGTNADVVAGSGEIRYTYVSMYIAAKGMSLEMPPSEIYSQPTFIGIFRLAEWSN